MRKIFNETLPDVLSGQIILGDVNYELVHYGRYQRCVIRYTVEGRQPDTSASQNQIIYGKVDGAGSGGLTVPVLAALREKVHDADKPGFFNIPRSIAYYPDMKLVLIEALPGEPIMKTLYQARLRQEITEVPGRLTLDQAIQSSARIAATLHASGIKFGRRQTMIDEIECLQEDLQLLTGIFPDLGRQLHVWLDEISDFARQSPPLPLCFNHGDFKYSQLVFDGQASGLLDYDGVCQAEPALDLGQFLAYQRMGLQADGSQEIKAPVTLNDELRDLFLKSYFSASQMELADEVLLRDRVTAYEMISLIRLVSHNWQKLKGPQLLQTFACLEDEMPKMSSPK
jgi:hypothetical protein